MVKKYANILMQRADANGLISLLKICTEFSRVKEYEEILQSKLISKNVKISFIVDLLKSLQVQVDNSFINLVSLLASDGKLNMLGQIYPEIMKQQKINNGIYQGVIYTKTPLDEVDIDRYSEKLSAKLGKQISLSNQNTTDDEIRIVLDDLGYEIVLSNEIIKKSIKEFIIKAI